MTTSPASTPSLSEPRADAALSLLQRIVDGSLDPSYAEAARRSRGTGSGRRQLAGGLAVAGVLGVVGLLLASVVAQTWQGLPDLRRTKAELVRRVEAATAADTADQEQVRELAAEVAALRRTVLAGEADATAAEEQLAGLQAAAGVATLVGPGVTVTLDDGPASGVEGAGPDLARVLDRDLQMVVNGLFAAGAEAVAVNGRRMTTTSAIRSAGDAILVGYRPLVRPYVVTAVGDARTLEARFVDSASGRELSTLTTLYQMPYSVSTDAAVTVPGEAATMTRYAHPVVR